MQKLKPTQEKMEPTIDANGGARRTAQRTAVLAAGTIEPGGFALACDRAGSVGDTIVAYVDGISIGRSASLKTVDEGEIVRVETNYFPCVSLPCQVRFGLEAANRDAAAPLIVRTAAEVEHLVGVGRLDKIRLTMENGILRGVAINEVNGLGRPALLFRVNGSQLRTLQIESLRMREEGGCYLGFGMPIEASDLTPAGICYELLQMPEMTLLAVLSFPRADALAISSSVGKLEAAVEGIRKRLNLELARLYEQRMRSEQESHDVLESVVEYLVALMYDRVAGRSDQTAESAADDAMVRFRRLLADAGSGRGKEPSGQFQHIRPSAPTFIDGWFEVEHDNRGFEFRWMGLDSSLLNANPSRSVAGVTFTIGATASGLAPQISAMFDGEPVDVQVVASANGSPYTIRLRPHKGPMPVLVVRLKCGHTLTADRAQEASERRVLTVAAMGATFYYTDS